MPLLSTILFGLATLIFGLRGDDPVAIFAAAAIWGLAYGGVPTLFQTALAKASGNAADLAQAMLVTVWNVAIAVGGIVGGLLLDRVGTGAFAPALLGLLVASLIVIGTARRHGFPSAKP